MQGAKEYLDLYFMTLRLGVCVDATDGYTVYTAQSQSICSVYRIKHTVPENTGVVLHLV